MFNLHFSDNGRKDCTTVHLDIDIELGITRFIMPFTFEAGTQYACKLLAQHLNKKLEDAIKHAHRQAYLRGYKDGRGKQKKKNWFASGFCGNNDSCY